LRRCIPGSSIRRAAASIVGLLRLERVDHLAELLHADIRGLRVRAKRGDDVIVQPLAVELERANRERSEDALFALEVARRERGDRDVAVAELDVAAPDVGEEAVVLVHRLGLAFLPDPAGCLENAAAHLAVDSAAPRVRERAVGGEIAVEAGNPLLALGDGNALSDRV